jgi:isopenicillin N synthase-like dioxygenase
MNENAISKLCADSFDTKRVDIPVIDVSAFVSWKQGGKSEQAAVPDVVRQVDYACRNVGFMVLSGTGLPDKLFRSAMEATKLFFSSSTEYKLTASNSNDPNYRGFEKVGVDKEAWEMGLELPAETGEDKLPLHGPNKWPNGGQSLAFREIMSTYFDSICSFAKIVMSAMCMALGLPEDHMDDCLKQPLAHLRIWRYALLRHTQQQEAAGAKLNEGDDGSATVLLPEHTDHGFLTLLLQDGGGGLQVRSNSKPISDNASSLTGGWVDVPAIPHTIVVNTGRLLARWTNGRYLATYHRVVVPSLKPPPQPLALASSRISEETAKTVEKESGCSKSGDLQSLEAGLDHQYRYSMPLFFAPSYHTSVEPLPACCNEGSSQDGGSGAADQGSVYEAVLCGEYIAAGYTWQGAVNAGADSASAAEAADAHYETHSANTNTGGGNKDVCGNKDA